MFELSVACKYLIPRWRQLSVSIISLVSILVIALVVWLIVVFFSVKDGLENSWVDKIVALTAPIRVSPTDQYYHSYYYLIDSISANSDYSLKNIGEKLTSSLSDPYDPTNDEEVPPYWSKPLLNTHGELIDLTKQVALKTTLLTTPKNLKISDYATTMANVRLNLLRYTPGSSNPSQKIMDHAAYIGSFDNDTPVLAKALLPLSPVDFTNLLHMQYVAPDSFSEDNQDGKKQLNPQELQQHLQNFFNSIEIISLKTPSMGWRLPANLIPANAEYDVAILIKTEKPVRLYIPIEANGLPSLLSKLSADGLQVINGKLKIKGHIPFIEFNAQPPIALESWIPFMLEGDAQFDAQLLDNSIATSTKANDLLFKITSKIQGTLLNGDFPLGRLEISEAKIKEGASAQHFATTTPNKSAIVFPEHSQAIDTILLPRSFKDAGALVGDQGYISYYSPTPSNVQEQRLPVVVAGFYDPGIMPLGGKYILAPRELISLIRSSYEGNDVLAGNGINIRFDNLKDAQKIKAELLKALENDGIASYWKIQTYQEYEFTKDLIQQLHSEKNLFSVISLVIIIVACSNIISMLIILVNDKKLEIGILRSMGASSGSIAIIFGICGMVMGTIGSLIGIFTAMLTLRYINELVAFIGQLQGHDLFNPVFYGNTLPSELSVEALTFVVITTAFISLLAGVVPAVKASMLRPSAILRAE